jgi:uncharacterized membrane protein YgaE (UPF0421/DUF939 family)
VGNSIGGLHQLDRDHVQSMTHDIRERVTTASAFATGTEGPVRVALDRLRRYGIGERVIKSALAAGLAWLIAVAIHDDPLPVLAPITAIFTIQLTLARSILGSVQRLLGVGAGVAMAMIANRLLGLHWWAISLVVLISLIAGFRVFRLESAGVEQMTVSGLLVMISGASGNIIGAASFHILDTIIGTAVGLAANSLIAPPSHVPGARQAVRALGFRLVAVLDELAAALASGIERKTANEILERARGVATDIKEVQAALERAEESLIYNLPGHRQKPALTRYRRANRALEHAAIQARVISRTVTDCVRTATLPDIRPRWLEPDALGLPLANLFSATAIYLEHFLDLPDHPLAREDDGALVLEIRECRRKVSEAVAARFEELLPDHWVLIGEIVSISDQLLSDLIQGANDISSK